MLFINTDPQILRLISCGVLGGVALRAVPESDISGGFKTVFFS